jgi:hypothetical protein
MCQGGVKSKKLVAFLILTNFLHENYRNEPPDGNPSRLSQQFLLYYQFLTENSGGVNKFIFSAFSTNVSRNLESQMTDFQNSLIYPTVDGQDGQYRTIFKETSLFGILV